MDEEIIKEALKDEKLRNEIEKAFLKYIENLPLDKLELLQRWIEKNKKQSENNGINTNRV